MTQLEKELQALKQEREAERVKQEQTVAQQRQQEAQQAILGQIKQHIATEKDSLFAVPGGEQAIFQKMAEHYRQTKASTGKGVELTPKQAAEMVEKEWQVGFKEFMKSPKFRQWAAEALNGAQPQKSKAGPRIPAAAAPQTENQRDLTSIYRGDKELDEAIRIMQSRGRARQE
jgi:hypothetical protein